MDGTERMDKTDRMDKTNRMDKTHRMDKTDRMDKNRLVFTESDEVMDESRVPIWSEEMIDRNFHRT